MSYSSTVFTSEKSFGGTILNLEIDSKNESIKKVTFHCKDNDAEEFYGFMSKKVEGLKIEHAFDVYLDILNLAPGKKPILNLGLYLIQSAIDDFTNSTIYMHEDKNRLCLCYDVTKIDVENFVLKDKNFELKNLIELTKASSACGTCKSDLIKSIDQVRLKHGMIKGLDYSKSRFDKEGHWVKIAGMYPGPLLIKLDELKNEWMKREEIVGKYEIFISGIEGFHLEIETHGANEKVRESLIIALSNYLQSKMGVLFFLK